MASSLWEYLVTVHEDVKQSGGKTFTVRMRIHCRRCFLCNVDWCVVHSLYGNLDKDYRWRQTCSIADPASCVQRAIVLRKTC